MINSSYPYLRATVASSATQDPAIKIAYQDGLVFEVYSLTKKHDSASDTRNIELKSLRTSEQSASEEITELQGPSGILEKRKYRDVVVIINGHPTRCWIKASSFENQLQIKIPENVENRSDSLNELLKNKIINDTIQTLSLMERYTPLKPYLHRFLSFLLQHFEKYSLYTAEDFLKASQQVLDDILSSALTSSLLEHLANPLVEKSADKRLDKFLSSYLKALLEENNPEKARCIVSVFKYNFRKPVEEAIASKVWNHWINGLKNYAQQIVMKNSTYTLDEKRAWICMLCAALFEQKKAYKSDSNFSLNFEVFQWFFDHFKTSMNISTSMLVLSWIGERNASLKAQPHEIAFCLKWINSSVSPSETKMISSLMWYYFHFLRDETLDDTKRSQHLTFVLANFSLETKMSSAEIQANLREYNALCSKLLEILPAPSSELSHRLARKTAAIIGAICNIDPDPPLLKVRDLSQSIRLHSQASGVTSVEFWLRVEQYLEENPQLKGSGQKVFIPGEFPIPIEFHPNGFVYISLETAGDTLPPHPYKAYSSVTRLYDYEKQAVVFRIKTLVTNSKKRFQVERELKVLQDLKGKSFILPLLEEPDRAEIDREDQITFLVPGHYRNLADTLASSPDSLSLEKRVRIVQLLMMALSTLEQSGIVHKNLDTAHIVFDPREGHDQVILTNFQNSFLTSPSEDNSLTLTSTGLSEENLPPEWKDISEGKQTAVSPAFDRFSLGKVLPEVLFAPPLTNSYTESVRRKMESIAAQLSDSDPKKRMSLQNAYKLYTE